MASTILPRGGRPPKLKDTVKSISVREKNSNVLWSDKTIHLALEQSTIFDRSPTLLYHHGNIPTISHGGGSVMMLFIRGLGKLLEVFF